MKWTICFLPKILRGHFIAAPTPRAQRLYFYLKDHSVSFLLLLSSPMKYINERRVLHALRQSSIMLIASDVPTLRIGDLNHAMVPLDNSSSSLLLTSAYLHHLQSTALEIDGLRCMLVGTRNYTNENYHPLPTRAKPILYRVDLLGPDLPINHLTIAAPLCT